jgi:hypothetical protein
MQVLSLTARAQEELTKPKKRQSAWHGNAARAEAPDLGADQGLRLVDSRGSLPATMQQASSRALENPAIANYRFRALKVPPGVETSRHRDKDSIQ